MQLTSLARLFLVIATWLVVTNAFGQEVPTPRFNSPYSRIGVGDLSANGYATQMGMGGVGIAFADPRIASPTNPASLGGLRYTSFQVGVELDRTTLEAGALESRSTNGNLRYISLAFPLQNSLQQVLDGKASKWRNGMMIALTPYSDIGYNIELTSAVDGLGTVRNSFLGSGGYYRLQWGNGVEYGDWRGGLSLSYIFGRTNSQQIVLPVGTEDELIGASTLTDTDALRARGVELQLGLQRDFVLERAEEIPTRILSVGATYTAGTTLNGEGTRVATSRNFLTSNFQGFIDTLVFQQDEEQTVELPATFGIGVYYNVVNSFSIGFDFSQVLWSNFENSLRASENLQDVTRLSFGGEWTPNSKGFGKYWSRAKYRFGAYANQSPREGVDQEIGATFGVGLPVVRPREETSYVNLSLNIGQFGQDADISQRYVRLVAGFTLTDNSWFYKRRFN